MFTCPDPAAGRLARPPTHHKGTGLIPGQGNTQAAGPSTPPNTHREATDGRSDTHVSLSKKINKHILGRIKKSFLLLALQLEVSETHDLKTPGNTRSYKPPGPGPRAQAVFNSIIFHVEKQAISELG